jgi:hypothetical protein
VDPKACGSPTRNNNEDSDLDRDTMKGDDKIQLGPDVPTKPKGGASAKEEETRTALKPVVTVHTRAQSAGSMRMNFSKKNIRNGGSLYRQHLLRVLPRLTAFEPPELPPRERVRQLALDLRRTYGHPSLRFALSQCNIFPVGSLVPLRTLSGVCSSYLLEPAARYVSNTFMKFAWRFSY